MKQPPSVTTKFSKSTYPRTRKLAFASDSDKTLREKRVFVTLSYRSDNTPISDSVT